MFSLTRTTCSMMSAVALALVAVQALAQMPNAYGAPINLESARKIATAALAEARKNSWTMAVAVIDGGGDLVYFERLDGTQAGSVQVAINKARSAALFKRPTKVFEDAVAGGRNAILRLDGAVPIEGGVPIVMDGKIVGAIGASGGTAPQDGQVARAGAESAK